ncbi:dihydrofolate reductase [Isoptericola jiangsuensis]|uniref:Dihydrofolate reductase n=1 Tax=Isoptericola jiangsuensis TaxID=548579 RepID=A0A2A9EZ09_9MICO|nr:dihydrofolate reductase family protein [Isoptericola jiangsuensis]PFG43379.1 dihydrofolate reductase [Isoptericola jiangsuensis]
MSIVTCDLTVSLDGYAAGPNPTRERPFGDVVGTGEVLHSWMFDHAANHEDEIAGILDADAYVMGRGMFSPDTGPWDPAWRGWWGEEPPYRAPVFVLTHHAREPLEMGETTFTFVTDGLVEAMTRARLAAGERPVSVAGGTDLVNQCLRAGIVDELRIHVVPVVLAVPGGTRLFDGVGRLDLDPAGARWTPEVTHLTYRRRAD